MDMKQYIFIVLGILFTLKYGWSQNFDKLNIPIKNNGSDLTLLNVGGLKAPQFSNIDFNGDGIDDLFIFDRNGDVIIPLVKIGSTGSLDYRYAPEYIEQFPKLQAWALLEDFNDDGVPDIFTSSSVWPNCCVEVWRGSRNQDGTLSYRLVTFKGLPFREILQFHLGNSSANIYVSPIDLPAIKDVDGDGDLDIISFEPDGSYASFYQNVAIDEGLGLDTFKFVRTDPCWGKFSENQYNDSLKISDNAFGCASFLKENGQTGLRHSGSTLTIFDSNGDGLLDLVLGDIGSSRLALLTNGGTAENAWMKSITKTFPSTDDPADLDIFLSAFYVDADGDQIKDLIVVPNDISAGENSNHIWLYKNTGSNEHPNFVLIKKDFLIDQMPFFYGGSHPVFTDVNGDGLMDIVVGISNIIKKNVVLENRLILLLNTGTATSPSYEVADEDWLNFSRFKQFTGRFAPFFADMDGDGDNDLLIGDSSGQLYYLKNTGGAHRPYQFDEPIYPYMDIFAGQNAKPFVVDADGDGLMDIILGKKNNELNFFKNQGTSSEPYFDPNPSATPNIRQLGKIFTGNDYYTQNGAPYYIRTEEGQYILLLGTEAGNIKTYRINDHLLNDYALIDDFTGHIHEGRKVVPALADIDNDGYYEMVVGNERGGLAFFNTIFRVDGTSSVQDASSIAAELILYPNPANHEIFVYHPDANAKITLKNIQGQTLMELHNGRYNLLPESLPQGLNFVHTKTAHNITVKKVIIVR